MNLIVGAPVFARNWILPTWYEHTMAAVEQADVDVSFMFVVDDNDEETIECLYKTIDRDTIVLTADGEHKDTAHKWSAEDFLRMATLRNVLLGGVRNEAPDLFLSLDSDLLLEPESISAQLHGIELGYDAVGIVTSMCRHNWCESWMYYAPTAKAFVRPGQRAAKTEHFPVDAIMAGKLMAPKAYSIDYKDDPQGEDLGWNRSAYDAKVKRGIHGSARARHVMNSEDLEKSPIQY